MKQKVIKTGNSLAVTVPANFVKQIGVKPGQMVEVKVNVESGKIVYQFSGVRQLAINQDIVS